MTIYARQMSIVEDRPGGDREVIATGSTLKLIALLARYTLSESERMQRTPRPTELLKSLTGLVVAVIPLDQLQEFTYRWRG